MFGSTIQKALRLAASAVSLLVVSFVAIALLVMLFQSIKQQQVRRERVQFTEQLFEDPVAIRLRNESKERCPRKEFEHYWICGAVIKAAPLNPRGYCSTPERPLYYGSLDSASQETALGELKFLSHAISVGDVGVRPTNDHTPYAYPRLFPPEDLQESEPAFSKNNGYPDGAWVIYKDLPVLVGNGSRDWSLTQQERIDMPAVLTLRHPVYPLQITKRIALEHMDDWRDHVDDAIETVSGAIESFDASRNCSDPPPSVRFALEPHKIREIAAVRDWLRDFSAP